MLSLKLWRRVRQESCKSEILLGGGTADVGVSICTPRRVVIVRVNSEVSVGGARVTVLDSSAPVTLRGGGIGRNHFSGAMQCEMMDDGGIP